MSIQFNTGFVEEWWTRVRAGEKLVQECLDCGHLQMHPRRLCNECAKPNLKLTQVSGRGQVYSFTTVYRNPPSEFASHVPYTLAIVKLEEGPQMLSRIVDCAPEDIRCDQPVEWLLAEIGDLTLPVFRPAK